MNLYDKKNAGDSGEGTPEAGGGTDKWVGGVYAGTNVVGSSGAAAAVIAVVTRGMLLHKEFSNLLLMDTGQNWLDT